MDAEQLIASLGLVAHPEGGHYAETYRDAPADGSRGAVTSIYYLLRAGERSHWHRIDAAEIWTYHAGAPLRLSIAAVGAPVQSFEIGGVSEPLFQAVVPPGAWQSAESLGAWTLVGCVVAPAFAFEGFELAAPDWSPGAPE